MLSKLNGRSRILGARIARTRGMTLIEVLVALVVISVGLLGVAALQLTSLRNSQGSYLRTQATALADDIIDRMRANHTAAIPSSGASPYVTAIGTVVTLGSTPTRATRDLVEWKQALQKLPGLGAAVADGSIAVDTATRIVTITIQWGERDTHDPNDTAAAPYAVRFITRTEI